MFILPDNCIFVDVDDTLLLPADGCFLPTDVNKPLVEKIKEWSINGRTIVVWTSNAAGSDWAKKAVYKCGLEEFVSYVMAKPSTIVDDDHLEYYNIIDPRTLRLKK